MAQAAKKKNNKKKRKKKVQVLKNNTKTNKKKTSSKNTKKKSTSKKQTSSSSKKKQNTNNKQKNSVVKQKNNAKAKNGSKSQKTPKKSSAKKKSTKLIPNTKKQTKKEVASPKLSAKTRKKFILISIFCLVLALLIIFPYGRSEYISEASGKILDIPKFSKLTEECCNYKASFTSFRSYTMIKTELEKILKDYEKLTCEGKTYYYNKDQDFTITEYKISKGFIFNDFSISYGKGNSCKIDTTLQKIELLPSDYSIEDAKKDGSYVIINDEIFNEESYTNFLNNIEQKISSTLRIAKLTEEGDLILTDLKYLDNGKFEVIYDNSRDRFNEDDDREMTAYYYDSLGIYKDKLYAYNGEKITNANIDTDDVFYLFDIKE